MNNGSNNIPECIFTEGTWLDFRDEIKKVDQELFNIIEKISPSKKYQLFKGEYLYGEKITDLGTICLPNEKGQLRRLDDGEISSRLKDQFNYCATPLIIQVGNGAEVFIEAFDRIIPLNVFHPGDLYGLFEAVTPLTDCPIRPCWSVTAGARSVFFSAKISDAIGHKRLRTVYNAPEIPPKRLVDQWDTFRAINKNFSSKKLWRSSIIIFGKDWFDKNKNDISWLRFHKYLLVRAWQQAEGIRSRLVYDSLLWEHFSKIVCKKNLKPNPYLIDTIKHILKIANGSYVGFKPINDNEKIFPSKIIEKAYLNTYGLKYFPLIIGPAVQNTKSKNTPIYYSLSYPTLLEGIPAIRTAPSIITELCDMRRLLNMLKDTLQGGQDANFFKILHGFNFKYFHDGKEPFDHILNSELIPQHDANIANLLKVSNLLAFPSHSPFFRGCVQITTNT